MRFLDEERLRAIPSDDFRSRSPYPWLNPEGLLTPSGFARLVEILPDVALFEPVFGRKRAHGQRSHDRYALEYRDDLPVHADWHAFVRELRGDAYHRFLCRLLDVRDLWLSFHWHYTPNGCSVSPHCDAYRKLGSHIFYLNSEADWKEDWGGGTLVLDDGGRIGRRSAPTFEEFDREIAAETVGNLSLVFERTPHSWHGVREVQCPEGAMRKIFVVVINRMRPLDRARRLVGLPLEAGY